VRPRVIELLRQGIELPSCSRTRRRFRLPGPKQRVEAVEAATTDPVDASGTMERGTFVVNAFVSDPLVQIVRPAPVRVTVLMEKINAEPAPQGTKRPNEPADKTVVWDRRDSRGRRRISAYSREHFRHRTCSGHDLLRVNPKARVVIGQDTRESSGWIADRVTSAWPRWASKSRVRA